MTRLRTFFAALLAFAFLAAAPAFAQTMSLTRASAGDLFSADATSSDYIALQLTGTWAGTVVFESSNDGTNWTTLAGIRSDGISASSTTSNNVWTLPATQRYVRARVSTYTSGTVQGVAVYGKGTLAPYTTLNVTGLTAHSSAASGNPSQVACVARTAADITLAASDAVALPCSSSNGVIVSPYSPGELYWQYAAATGGIVNTTTAVTMKAAAGASIRNYITSCQIGAEALGAATELVIRDGAAGTVIWRYKIGTAGLTLTDIDFPVPLKGTANTLLEAATLTASVSGGVFVNCQGYQAF